MYMKMESNVKIGIVKIGIQNFADTTGEDLALEMKAVISCIKSQKPWRKCLS